MSKSIMCNKRECYICKRTDVVHKHHVMNGTANRKKSEEDGLWVYLCLNHHTEGRYAVHNNQIRDNWLKSEAEKAYIEQGLGTKRDFIKRYGKNYLD